MTNLQAYSLFVIATLNLILSSIPSTSQLIVARGPQNSADPINPKGAIPRHVAGEYDRKLVNQRGNVK